MNYSYPNSSCYDKIYQPIEHKTFKSALMQFLKQEVPHLGGDMILELLTNKIQTLIDDFYPKSERLTMGQMLWFAIDENEKAGYGKNMKTLKIKPVILSLVHPNDIELIKKGVPSYTIKDQVMARLYRETKEQGAVLAESDVSLMLHMTPTNISKRTKKYEQQFHTVLPRRGTVHDLGRSVTHKKTICKKRILENKPISQIARETNHTSNSVTRYTNDLERVRFCLDKKLKLKEISFVTNLSPSLTIEYVSLIDEIKKQKLEQKRREQEELPF